MGYDLHIARGDWWDDDLTDPVTKDEIDTLISKDSELAWSVSDYVEFKTPLSDELIKVTKTFAILWNGTSCFWWDGRSITCKNPSELEQRKMIQIALRLRAKVVGDEGETYFLRRALFGPDKICMQREQIR